MALRIAIDAGRYVDFCRGVDHAVAVVRRAAEIGVPVLVLGQLRAAMRSAGGADENERALAMFLRSSRVRVLSADEGTARAYAQLVEDLGPAAGRVATNVIWTAALVVQHDLALFTRDDRFDAIPHLPRV